MLYVTALISPRLWNESVLGGLGQMPGRARMGVALLWTLALAGLSCVAGALWIGGQCYGADELAPVTEWPSA